MYANGDDVNDLGYHFHYESVMLVGLGYLVTLFVCFDRTPHSHYEV